MAKKLSRMFYHNIFKTSFIPRFPSSPNVTAVYDCLKKFNEEFQVANILKIRFVT